MKKIVFSALLGSLLLVACGKEEWGDSQGAEMPSAVFKLYSAGYDGGPTRSLTWEKSAYDKVFYYLVVEDGNLVEDIKSAYNPSSSEIYVEGLHAGSYRLLVLGVKGDESKDRATIHSLTNASDRWLTFPADLRKPLEAEYFYSQTPFTVERRQTAGGSQEVASLTEEVRQERIMGRIEFDFGFNNPYVRNAVVSKTLSLNEAHFATTLSGDGNFGGESDGVINDLSLDRLAALNFMPVVGEAPLSGTVSLLTRNYLGESVEQSYTFSYGDLRPNYMGRVVTRVSHPEDRSGVMFLTGKAYAEGKHGKILQDGEPKEVYTDPGQRKFNTSEPLQLSLTDDGRLHARFYSPRDLGDVLIRVRVPALGDEYFDMAYFDTIPAFADFYGELPILQRDAVLRTETGRNVEVGKMDVSGLLGAAFKVVSGDDYWAKLQKIEHGWDVYWGLYGGNPDLPDGGSSGNWMGIRPVHCRESVAFFINFTYMIDMPEHEEILRENEDILDGNGGVDDKVTAENVLRQMRQKRTLQVGLVYPGNGVLGLGGGSVFGAYQQAWLRHYDDYYACEIMFHELGHVMGYSHSSSFTYGPWAQELMNHFYVDNLNLFPVDSSDYLRSPGNPNLYNP